MDDDAGTGCAIVLGLLIALPFFIAAIPVLAGITFGIFFWFVIIPAIVAFVAGIIKNIFG